MVKLIWSPQAASDLVEICEFISKDSEDYAKIYAQRIVSVIDSIPKFPRSGRVVPEYRREDVRERIFQNYRIVYRVKVDAIEVTAIVHCARLLPDIN
jgi:toxin ParE1/3/4